MEIAQFFIFKKGGGGCDPEKKQSQLHFGKFKKTIKTTKNSPYPTFAILGSVFLGFKPLKKI